jgi:uncharacterized protein (TIGR01244 family)
MNRRSLALSLVLLAFSGCGSAAEQARPDAAERTELVPNQKAPAPGAISGGQPSREQLVASRDAGYRTVMNLRTPGEGGAIDDETALVAELGMDYVSIPIAGAAGLTRDNVEAFARALEAAERPVLIHCGSGNRIGALFALKAFYLDGKSAEEALSIGRASGLTRLEGAVREILESAAPEGPAADAPESEKAAA